MNVLGIQTRTRLAERQTTREQYLTIHLSIYWAPSQEGGQSDVGVEWSGVERPLLALLLL